MHVSTFTIAKTKVEGEKKNPFSQVDSRKFVQKVKANLHLCESEEIEDIFLNSRVDSNLI